MFCLQTLKKGNDAPILMAIWEDAATCDLATGGLAQIFGLSGADWVDCTTYANGKAYFTPDDVRPTRPPRLKSVDAPP